MEQPEIEKEILSQVVELMEKSGFEPIAPLPSAAENDSGSVIEAMLINLKTLNAKYDKNEAIYQIKCLMGKYNIQLDQLVDGRGVA